MALKNFKTNLMPLVFNFTFCVLNMFHQQEIATIMLNYHIFRVVLGSKCVGESVWLGWVGLEWYPCCNLKHNFSLQEKISYFETKHFVLTYVFNINCVDGNIY